MGEGATLTFDEKQQVFTTVVEAAGDRVPVVAGISALSTTEAVALARMAQAQGCSGLMVLPPYVYAGDWREMQAHVAAVISGTALSCMLYNNPSPTRLISFRSMSANYWPLMDNLHAIKESSADLRRVAALRALAGDRIQICCGVDDVIVGSHSRRRAVLDCGSCERLPARVR